MNDNDEIDPRFSLAAWQRYELHVAAWMDTYPLEYTFSPNELSLETVIARLRDAVKAKLTYGYPSSIVDHNLLRERWPNVVTTRHRTLKGVVRIGPKEGKNLIQLTASRPLHQRGLVITSPIMADLMAVAHLLNRSIITGEVAVRDVSHEVKKLFLTHLQTFPNVEYIEQNETNFTLL